MQRTSDPGIHTRNHHKCIAAFDKSYLYDARSTLSEVLASEFGCCPGNFAFHPTELI